VIDVSNKPRQFKASQPKVIKQGREGLMHKDGKIIHDDSWLHPEAGVKPISPKVSEKK
jgi:hypothetical protein